MRSNINAIEFEFIQGLTADLSAPVLIFPTSLHAAMKIRRAISQEDISEDHLARVIMTEPVLSAQILKLSNSAEYNPAAKLTVEMRTALARLGLARAQKLIISVGAQQLEEHKNLDEAISKYLDGLWRRSLRVATLALVIARSLTKVSPDKAMLAGLLHDMGKFYLLNRAKNYQSLFPSIQALWNTVDAWHANIGGAILENWEVADEIRHAVQNVSNLDYMHPGATNLTDVIVAANLLDAHFEGIPDRKLDLNNLPRALLQMELTVEKCEELRRSSHAELDLLLNPVENNQPAT